MLTVYRRHRTSCPHRGEGREYRRCRCPIWTQGTVGNAKIRQSLKARDWAKAQAVVRQWEAEGLSSGQPEPVSIETAGEDFLRDGEARGLREPTLYKYRLLLRGLRDFARECGFRFLKELDVPALRAFRASWPNQNLAALKKLECLRTFFRFAHVSGWLSENPALKIKSPKVTNRPTLPFTREEAVNILAACEKYPGRPAHGRRLRALLLLLRHSGLRIRDAVTLSRDRITNGRLFLYTAKTGTPVYCPLPPFVTQALDSMARSSPYYFWSGESKPKSAVGDYQRALKRLFETAGVTGGHAHRFRDTFAVELLLAGVPLERVSVLLGHQGVRVTEKHYSPWVRARQEQLEADVRRTWGAAPEVLSETKGTPEVHGKTARVN